MSARICRTAADAFQAGWDAPCEHKVPDPGDCPDCALTDTEIAQLAVLLRGLGIPSSATTGQAA
ncbi:hypothetical protein ACIP4X_17625 [Streptomyces sp. NPDC088817]|uniref:hypothetical protein n=1 Tax=Streptomyces sp. NPDC088817 TaxID=3365907 RepID=UPI003811DCD2